jgi:hypothetical protein
MLQVEQLSVVIKHHIPAAVLFRDHWAGLLLQFLLEASFGTLFYTFFTWVPSHLAKELGVPSSNTLWALLIGLVLFAVMCPLAGHYIGDTRVSSSACLQGSTAFCCCCCCYCSSSRVQGWPKLALLNILVSP